MDYDHVLPFLVYLITVRNAGGLEHSDEVTRLSVQIGKRAGLPAVDLGYLEFSARVHDIGKLAINDSVINKPGRFTPAERITMQQHVTFGVEMLRRIPSIPEAVIEMVGDHHENFDGTGYPKKTRGNQISAGGRILRIADTFSAMTSTYRVYRATLTESAALRVMQDNAELFDPLYYSYFLEVIHAVHE